MIARVKIAVVAGAHGVKGEVKIRALTETAETLAALSPLMDAEGKQVSLQLTGTWAHGVIGRLSGIATRETAQAAKGMELFASADALPALAPGEYYISQLINLEVKNTDNQMIGKVSAVEHYGAGNLLEVTFIDGEAALFPFAPDIFEEKDGALIFTPPEVI